MQHIKAQQTQPNANKVRTTKKHCKAVELSAMVAMGNSNSSDI